MSADDFMFVRHALVAGLDSMDELSSKGVFVRPIDREKIARAIEMVLETELKLEAEQLAAGLAKPIVET